MKKKILLSDFLNPEKKIAINCQTEAEAKEFLRMFGEKGVKSWLNGTKLSKMTCFGSEQTTYNFCVDNYLGCAGLWFCDKGYYIDAGFTVYCYSEVEFVDDKGDVAVENNKDGDLKKDVLMVIDQLNRLQKDAEMKQNQYKNCFEQWAVLRERESAYRTAAMLLERVIKA